MTGVAAVTAQESLEIKTDIARAFLANAGLFKTPKAVVWEYVANGLQYHDKGIKPVVKVTINNEQVVIEDNGSGMDTAGLAHFFTLHAENKERKSGNAGRGYFGTGKSAAFAIAGKLEIDTCRNGLRNVVELKLEELNKHTGAERIAVNILIKDEKTTRENGTKIIISELFKAHKKIDANKIIKYIEDQPYINNPRFTLSVNGTKCEYQEPAFKKVQEYKPNDIQKKLLGDVTLKIKIAYLPLESEMIGVKVISSGEVHAVTLAGVEKKEMAQFLFGEIEVQKLEEEQDPPAIDVGRSRSLNVHNPVVRALYSFISESAEKSRLELISEKREQEKSEKAKQFRKLEEQVSDIINEHFNAFRSELKQSSAVRTGGHDQLDGQPAGEGIDETNLVANPAGIIQATTTTEELGIGRGDGEKPYSLNPDDVPEQAPALKRDDEAGDIKASAGGAKEKSRPKGGFSVQHAHNGETNPRTRYEEEKRIIWINLDHPQLKAAIKDRDIEDPTFKRLFYEVALIEYVFALMYERVKAGDYDAQCSVGELLFEVREQINTVTARAAFLYE